MEDSIGRLMELGKVRTCEAYITTFNSFRRFRKNRDLFLDNLNADLMLDYEVYLKGCGISQNTSSFYMRNLRAVYNKAVEKDLTVQRFPFKRVYTGVDKTVKRAVSVSVIRKLKAMDFSDNLRKDFARDMFMFSFYTRGMSFVDMAYLRKRDLANGILSYRRRKTGQRLFIKWEKPMQDIINKYDTADTPYLLPIIRYQGTDERLQYLSAGHRVNYNLRLIGCKIGLTTPLTMYVARHSWASIARSKNIPISVISEGMGHDSETTGKSISN